MLLDVFSYIAQTFVDKPEIILALVYVRQRHDLHQGFFVVFEQDRFVLLPEEVG
jgi:hypothetical protein